MANFGPNWGVGREAEVDLSDHQYRGVIVGTNDDQINKPGGAGVDILGVLEDDPAAGETGTVVMFGIAKIEVGAAVNALDKLTVAADGQFVAATAATVDTTTSSATQDVAGDPVQVIAMEGSGGAGERIEAFVMPVGLLS